MRCGSKRSGFDCLLVGGPGVEGREMIPDDRSARKDSRTSGDFRGSDAEPSSYPFLGGRGIQTSGNGDTRDWGLAAGDPSQLTGLAEGGAGHRLSTAKYG